MLPYLENGSYRCDQIKDSEIERLSWVIRLGSKCNHIIPYKREAKGDLTQNRGEGTQKRRQCDHRGRDQSDAARSQGTPAASRSQRDKGQIPN